MTLIQTTVADGRVIYLNLDHLSHVVRHLDGKLTVLLTTAAEEVEIVIENDAAEDFQAILNAFVLPPPQRKSDRVVLPFVTPPKDFPEAIP